MTMKHFLFLAAAAGFLPVLIVKPRTIPFTKILTHLKTVQDEIVNLHNIARRIVSPPAGNMLKMSWSEEAAKNARILSKKCDLAKSNAVKRRITHTFCGENRHWAPDSISWYDVIESWYNESIHFHYGSWLSAEEDKSESYTQMVWDSSYLIGCAVSPCCKTKSLQYLYVCHYCHEGNELNRKSLPYRMGLPCQHCLNNCDKKLCTNPCIYYDENVNCEMLKNMHGCSHPTVALLCKASCLCTTEIK